MSNAYASVAQFRTRYGAQKAATFVEGSAATQDTVIGDALDSSATLIETAASEGGFTVPIDVTTLTTDTGRQTQIAGLLRTMTINCATVLFLQHLDDTPAVKAAREACNRWLEQLRKGEGLGVQPPSGDGALEWVAAPGAPDDFTQQTLQRGMRVCL